MVIAQCHGNPGRPKNLKSYGLLAAQSANKARIFLLGDTIKWSGCLFQSDTVEDGYRTGPGVADVPHASGRSPPVWVEIGRLILAYLPLWAISRAFRI